MWSTPFNPFTWDKSSKRVTTDVASLDVRDAEGKNIIISGLTPGVTILLPLNRQTSHPVNVSFGADRTLRHHKIGPLFQNSIVKIWIILDESDVAISSIIIAEPLKTSAPFECKRVRGAWLNSRRIICEGKNQINISFTAFDPGYYVLYMDFKAVIENSGNVDEWEGNDNGCIKIRQPPSRPKKAKASYTFEVSESTCLFWQKIHAEWRTTGCKVKKLSQRDTGFETTLTWTSFLQL